MCNFLFKYFLYSYSLPLKGFEYIPWTLHSHLKLQKSGQRMKCSACQLIAHQNCIPIVNEKGQLACKPTYRDVGIRQYREQTTTHHHWVHRKLEKGKCKQCGKVGLLQVQHTLPEFGFFIFIFYRILDFSDFLCTLIHVVSVDKRDIIFNEFFICGWRAPFTVQLELTLKREYSLYKFKKN